MTTQLALKSSRFEIIDMQDEQYRCTVFITVKTLRYKLSAKAAAEKEAKAKAEYYDVTYTYEYACPGSKHLTPFNENEGRDSQSEDGDIIKKNAMTEKMVEYLLLDDEALGEKSGHMCPTDYKAAIMRSLSLFWD